MLAYTAAEEKVFHVNVTGIRKLHMLLAKVVPKHITLYQMGLCTKRFWFMFVATMEVEQKMLQILVQVPSC